MAVAVTVDVPGRTEQQCQQIAAKIVRDSMLPEGWLDAPGRPENGWRVVNVVPSQQESEDFAREQLLPALRPQRTRRLRRGSSFALAAWSRFKEVRPNTPIRTKVGLPNRARDHHHLSQRLHQPDLSG